MSNIISASDVRDFYVYVDPHCPQVKAGCFTTDSTAPAADALMFVPNPNFSMAASPFQNNLVRNYLAEYHLETARKKAGAAYPARLQGIFLLQDERAAEDYASRHPNHVKGRQLRRVHTSGDYIYSTHDSAWIDYLRLPQEIDAQHVEDVCAAYWRGEPSRLHSLNYAGAEWRQEPIVEVLYLGRIEFYSNIISAPFNFSGQRTA